MSVEQVATQVTALTMEQITDLLIEKIIGITLSTILATSGVIITKKTTDEIGKVIGSILTGLGALGVGVFLAEIIKLILQASGL